MKYLSYLGSAILFFFLFTVGCSSEPPQEVKDMAINKAKKGSHCAFNGGYNPNLECTDFKVREVSYHEPKPAQIKNGITETAIIEIEYFIREDIGKDWYAGSYDFWAIKKNGVWEDDRADMK